jgi:hypothetical protein
MSLPTFLAQARQHAAVGASLFALIANLGAPVPATHKVLPSLQSST